MVSSNLKMLEEHINLYFDLFKNNIYLTDLIFPD